MENERRIYAFILHLVPNWTGSDDKHRYPVGRRDRFLTLIATDGSVSISGDKKPSAWD